MALIASLVLAIILSGIEMDIFTPSFPEMIRVFNLSEFEIQLTLSVNFFAFCISSLVVGMLGDRYGRRSIILYSTGLFLIGGVFTCIANEFWVIVLGRFFQGLGMAGPAVLAYVVIADRYDEDRQTKLMATLNGLVASSMALAPIIGSYVNAAYGWRGNFNILLGVGILTFIACYLTIPKDTGNQDIRISFREYIPLLHNKKLMQCAMAIALVVIGYWVFVGFAPILYQRDMGVPLKQFGFYQGALCLSFGFTSILSSILYRYFSKVSLLRFGVYLGLLGTFSALSLAFLGKATPLNITIALCLYGVGNVFPIAILYPITIGIIPSAKARAASIVQALRLIMNAFAVQGLSLIYAQRYLEIGLFVFIATFIAYLLFRKLSEWNKIDSKNIAIA